VVIVRELILE